MRKQGQDGKTYYPPQNPRRKALQSVGFSGLIFHTSAPLFSHEIPLLFPQSSGGTSLGAIPCAAIREKGPAAYRARPGFRGGAIGEQGGLQRRIGRQNGLPEVAAIGPCPTLAKHITLTSQRQAALLPVIIGAHLRDQFSDTLSLVTGQFPAHQDFGPTWPEGRNFLRQRSFLLPHSFKWRHPAQRSAPPRPGRGWC